MASNASIFNQVTGWKPSRIHSSKPLQLGAPGDNVLLVDTLEAILPICILSTQMHPMPQSSSVSGWYWQVFNTNTAWHGWSLLMMIMIILIMMMNSHVMKSNNNDNPQHTLGTLHVMCL